MLLTIKRSKIATIEGFENPDKASDGDIILNTVKIETAIKNTAAG